MIDHRSISLPSLQRLADLGRAQAVMGVVTDDLARIGIGDQAQLGTALSGGQISDVGNSDLFARFGSNLIRTGFQQIGMAPETMVAVGRLVICPLGRHQQARAT